MPETLPKNLIARTPEQVSLCGEGSGGLLSRGTVRAERRDGEAQKATRQEEHWDRNARERANFLVPGAGGVLYPRGE